MKTDLKIFAGLILSIVAISYLLKIPTGDILERIDQEEDKYKNHIGEYYILDKDTLTIVDYSIFNKTFTLSNGVKLSYTLIEGKK